MSRFRSLSADTRGSVALIFGLVLIPLLGLIGFMIDYARAASTHAFLRNAVDAAILRAVSSDDLEREDWERAIETTLKDMLRKKGAFELEHLEVRREGGHLNVLAGTSSLNIFSQIFGYKRTPVSVDALAAAGGREAEVALVLDITGSMRDDMNALRSSATTLVDLLMPPEGKGVRVSVVPYVAAVNPGLAALPADYLDVEARSRWHAVGLRGKGIGAVRGCTENWTSGNPPPPDPGRAGGGDRSGSLIDGMTRFATALFGVTTAQAQVTPSTTPPLGGEMIYVSPAPNARMVEAFRPTGFGHVAPCWLMNPGRISHFDLFARIPNVEWKGCVEARPEPFDVTDDPPVPGDHNTLFVPYFWPDEPEGINGWVANYANNYMSDGSLPEGWDFESTWQKHYSILKYEGVATADVDDIPPFTRGPNAGCPDEVFPLSGDRDAIVSMINGLRHWEGGGTITSEGIAWGWRTLSPNPPFLQAKDYGDAEKIMIVMSDGKNSFVENNPGGSAVSDYTAYGYLRSSRFTPQTFSNAENYLNQRMMQVCDNVKAREITIYTVLFREVDANAREMMSRCASTTSNFFYASSQAELEDAFRRIGESIGMVRLLR